MKCKGNDSFLYLRSVQVTRMGCERFKRVHGILGILAVGEILILLAKVAALPEPRPGAVMMLDPVQAEQGDADKVLEIRSKKRLAFHEETPLDPFDQEFKMEEELVRFKRKNLD